MSHFSWSFCASVLLVKSNYKLFVKSLVLNLLLMYWYSVVPFSQPSEHSIFLLNYIISWSPFVLFFLLHRFWQSCREHSPQYSGCAVTGSLSRWSRWSRSTTKTTTSFDWFVTRRLSWVTMWEYRKLHIKPLSFDGLIVTNVETETKRCLFFNKNISAIHQIISIQWVGIRKRLFSMVFLFIRWLGLCFPVEQLETPYKAPFSQSIV